MKTPSVSLLLGVCVLLLSALIVSAVLVFYVPPYPLVRLVVLLVVFLPYAFSTVVMLSIESRLKPGCPLVYTMETALLDEETQEFSEEYDDIAADVTTEHVTRISL